MSTLKEDLKVFIETGLGGCPPVFLDYLPEHQERGVQIVEYGAIDTPLPFDYGIKGRSVRFVVKERGAKAAEDLAYALYGLINSGLSEEEGLIELNKDRKVVARPRGLPLFMAKDGAASLYSFNVVIHTNRR